MNKLEEFKTFIKDKEFLINKVNNKEITWQGLYEIYDLYGPDATIFQNTNNKNEETINTQQTGSDSKVNSLLKAFEGVDVNKINENLEGVRKILAVLGEFSKKDETKTKRTYERPSNRYDD